MINSGIDDNYERMIHRQDVLTGVTVANLPVAAAVFFATDN